MNTNEINLLFYDGDNPIFLRLRDGYENPISSEEHAQIINYSKNLGTKLKNKEYENEDLILIFQIIKDLGNFPDVVEAAKLFNKLLNTLECALEK